MLSVPLISQLDDYSCVPTCLKMVLEYVKNACSVCFPNLTIKEIAESIGTTVEDGTLFDDVERINDNKKIMQAIPSLGFVTEYACRFSGIEQEIHSERPVIAWILMTDKSREFKHSVVITGLDMEGNLIYYNDPIYGSVEKEIGTFISMWEKVDTVLIRVRIGDREQREMLEFVGEELKRSEANE
jgi:predicted double-glycine peptidase